MASGAVSQLIHPGRSILAGSTSATTELAATLHLTIANFASKWPGLKISLHVVDISLAGAHKQEDVLIQEMAEAFKHLHEGLVCNLHMTVAKAKTVVIASQEDIANALHKQLGDFGGSVEMHIRRLGVEHTHTYEKQTLGAQSQAPQSKSQACQSKVVKA